MAFWKVLMIEVFEVLRAWLAGQGKRSAAARSVVNREDGGPLYPDRAGGGAGPRR
jgi:hypothetical protein